VAEVLASARDRRGLVPLLRALDECPGAEKKLGPLLSVYPQVKQIRFLLRALKERWPSVKRFAARALIDLDSPEMIEPLLAATNDSDPEVQRAALQALSRFAKRPEVQRRLIELRDGCADEGTRQHAIAMLLGMDPGSVIEPLLQASRDDDLEVQLAAVEALGKYAQRPDVCARFIELLDYGDISLREKAMEMLGAQKVKEAVEPLIRYLSNPFLKFRAREALVMIGERKGILAIKRVQIRERLFGKKKEKGAIQPPMRKGRRTRGK
jgi:HEAT repeat protein